MGSEQGNQQNMMSSTTGSNGNWARLEDVDGLVLFGQANYPNFDKIPRELVKNLFETYKKTTYVYTENGEIKGFGLYQEWPDMLNFLMFYLPFSAGKNVKVMLKGRSLLPNKKIVWFNEKKMKARGV